LAKLPNWFANVCEINKTKVIELLDLLTRRYKRKKRWLLSKKSQNYYGGQKERGHKLRFLGSLVLIVFSFLERLRQIFSTPIYA
jgi:hypothetical protein